MRFWGESTRESEVAVCDPSRSRAFPPKARSPDPATTPQWLSKPRRVRRKPGNEGDKGNTDNKGSTCIFFDSSQRFYYRGLRLFCYHPVMADTVKVRDAEIASAARNRIFGISASLR